LRIFRLKTNGPPSKKIGQWREREFLANYLPYQPLGHEAKKSTPYPAFFEVSGAKEISTEGLERLVFTGLGSGWNRFNLLLT